LKSDVIAATGVDSLGQVERKMVKTCANSIVTVTIQKSILIILITDMIDGTQPPKDVYTLNCWR
jgi:hypothetical protein